MRASHRPTLLLFTALLLLAPTGSGARAQDAEFAAMVGQIRALSQAGKDKDAEAIALRLVARTRAKEGEESLNVALALEWLADVYAKQGRHKEELAVLQPALDMRKKLMSPTDPLLGSKYQNVASALSHLGRVKEALAVLQLSLSFSEKAYGPEHLKTAEAWHELARVQIADFVDPNNFRNFETSIRRALEIRIKATGPESREVAETLKTMAWNFAQYQRAEEAEQLFRQALAISERLGRKTGIALVLTAQSEIYMDQGRLREASAALERALLLMEQWAKENKQDQLSRMGVAQTMSNLGIAHFYEGRFEEGAAIQQRALTITEQVVGKDAPNLIPFLHSLGKSYHAVGRLEDAARVIDRQLALIASGASTTTSDYGQALVDRSAVARAQGRHREAVDFSRQGLQNLERFFQGNGASFGFGLARHGSNLAADQQSLEGKAHLERAVSVLTKSSGRENPYTAGALKELAAVECALGDTKNALAHAREATATFTKRAEIGLADSGATKREALSAGAYSAVICATLGEAAKSPAQREQLSSEALVAAQREGHTLASEALARMAARAGSASPEIANLLRTQQDLAARLEALDRQVNEALAGAGNAGEAAKINRLRKNRGDIETRLAGATAEIARRAPDLAALASPKPLSVADMRKLIKADEALVVFHVRPEGSYVWGLTREGVAFARIAGTAAVLAGKVSALRESMEIESAAGRLDFDPGLAHELYAALIGPIESVVRDKPHWLVVASGAVSGLPMHVLVTEKPAAPVTGLESYRDVAWLAKRHAVTTLPGVASLGSLRALAKATKATKPLKGFADPVFARLAHADDAAATHGHARIADVA